MNAWWMWKPQNFPPSKWIEPLMISMHIRPEIRKKFLTNKVRKYLIEKGPIGCRDMDTYEWLTKEDVPAYFSGCLTVTLQRNYKIPRCDYILCVDTSEEVVNKIKSLTNKPVYTISADMTPYYGTVSRIEFAKLILRLYHDAHLVVSSRLHAIMPSLAMETPVLRLISDREVMGGNSRYAGFEKFFNTIDLNNGIEELNKYDFDNPPKNPNNHLEIRERLIKTCSDFTGYNNTESLIDENLNPFIVLCRMNAYDKKLTERMVYFLRLHRVIKVLLFKLLGRHKFDLKDEMFK